MAKKKANNGGVGRIIACPLPVPGVLARVTRPLAEMSPENRWSICYRVDRMHCLTRFLDVARELRKSIKDAWRDYPVELRRGALYCAAVAHQHNKEVYHQVMRGTR